MAQNINIWSKVGVDVQTALGTAKTITAITKANPAEATSAAHGLADGDLVLLKITGMRQLNYRVARIANSDTNTFELEGIDSTLFDTFVSGTAEEITFGATAATFVDVTPSGGEAAPAPVSTIHEDQDFEIPGNRTPQVMAFNSLWDVTDPALVALAGFDNSKSICAVALRFATGNKVYFAAYPSANLAPAGSAGQVVTTPVTLRVRSRLQYYAT